MPDQAAVVRDLAFSYRNQPVLDGIDLALARAETVALLGPNGAGKTSLMRLLAGRLVPSRGSVRVAGGDPAREAAVRRAIAWVPQEIALYPRLTVRENLEVFARLMGLNRAARGPAVARALGRAGLEEVASRLVGVLSGGYQRRANIAAALLAEPALVLLDEPTQGVDQAARAAIHGVLERLPEAGAAVLIATHDFAEAERLADRVVLLQGGSLRLDGRLSDLLAGLRAGPPEHEVALAEAAGPAASAALRQAGFHPASPLMWRAGHAMAGGRDGAALLAHLRRHGVPVREIRVREPGLDVLYRDVTAEEPPAGPARLPAGVPA
ncbi:ABC transporter ATP-binding protein [Methylobacterium nonmethylotrophicum]|uniref:ABC transporter ATP-binding protein n=1 Tax=Methylobacterium nonmethylotrophicum TaxID=1141884 RepID=A0A4Z0NNT2_9HYPH|nr:ABC transporter ATP-binding protein [Methylobacterium nonmethylotrophicum]TGD98114.1 ABC transporter ATP-binding protein [Methylobacterium nonmethylotrophicum]